jgi:hypothetical protein
MQMPTTAAGTNACWRRIMVRVSPRSQQQRRREPARSGARAGTERRAADNAANHRAPQSAAGTRAAAPTCGRSTRRQRERHHIQPLPGSAAGRRLQEFSLRYVWSEASPRLRSYRRELHRTCLSAGSSAAGGSSEWPPGAGRPRALAAANSHTDNADAVFVVQNGRMSAADVISAPPLGSLRDFCSAFFGTIAPALVAQPKALAQWLALARRARRACANPHPSPSTTSHSTVRRRGAHLSGAPARTFRRHTRRLHGGGVTSGGIHSFACDVCRDWNLHGCSRSGCTFKHQCPWPNCTASNRNHVTAGCPSKLRDLFEWRTGGRRGGHGPGRGGSATGSAAASPTAASTL